MRTCKHEGEILATRFTEADFQAFVAEVRRCVELLGLKEWRVDFDFCAVADESYATCGWNVESRSSLFRLTARPFPVVRNKTTREMALESARHEACELLLSELNDMAKEVMSETMVNAAVHTVVRRLEKVLRT